MSATCPNGHETKDLGHGYSTCWGPGFEEEEMVYNVWFKEECWVGSQFVTQVNSLEEAQAYVAGLLE